MLFILMLMIYDYFIIEDDCGIDRNMFYNLK